MGELIGSIFILAGSFFLFSAGLGVLRMPDTYNRIQTGTKATTLGTILILIGMGFFHPDWGFKLFLLIYFIMLTNPVSSHALARAAHVIHTREAESTVIDVLDDGEGEDEETSQA